VTLGDNTHGQRGVGHCEPVPEPSLVSSVDTRFMKVIVSAVFVRLALRLMVLSVRPVSLHVHSSLFRQSCHNVLGDSIWYS
jgi:hypothetical protein